MARRAGRGLVAILCCLTALVVTPVHSSGAATSTTSTPVPPHAWVVADAGTGAILESHNAHVAYPPASTTKVMTALTAIERLPPDAKIKVNALTANQPASKINMQVGEEWPFNEALAALLVVSANDAAWAIAQATSGSVENFVKAETATARELGLRDSTFADPAGLDDGNAYKGGPLMSAYDIAITTRNALKVPVLAHLAASPVISFVGPGGLHHRLTNHNKLVSDHLYSGATGFKTGFTNKAGHTLIATATRGGRTLIAVVLGTYDAYGWATRFLDAGFADAPGPGAAGSLPPVRVSTYAARTAQLAAFQGLASSSASAAAIGVPDRAPVTTAAATATTDTAGAAPLNGTLAASRAAKKASGGLSTRTIVIIALVLLLLILYVLRVRAVRRARTRRLARRREAHNMMRRGSLPIVDGRYRTGTRVGKPVESHVQVRREEQRRRGQASG